MGLGFKMVRRSSTIVSDLKTPWLGSFVLMSSLLVSCTKYKPNSYRDQTGMTNPAVPGQSKEAVAFVSDVSLLLANTKLAELGGTLTARIVLGGQTVTQDFSPTGTQSELKGLKLPASDSSVLTVEILQGSTVRFVAKRAKTRVQAGGSIVVDDCLILRAPWAGNVNDGSCEWNITEVSN
jgi:hypothetical protein